MNSTMIDVAVELLGKSYMVKCSVTEMDALKQAAHYLEEKMRLLQKKSDPINLDKVIIVAALNVVHQLLEKETYVHSVNQRLQALHNQVEHVLQSVAQRELQPTE